MKRLLAVMLCLATILVLFTGCAGSGIKLTAEQEANIQLFVEKRDEVTVQLTWSRNEQPNYVYVSEFTMDDGTLCTWFTVAYVERKEADGGLYNSSEIFIAESYIATDNGSLVHLGEYADKDWISNRVGIDLKNMTDKELTEILQDAYMDYLRDLS